jgi:hypothetical protein
MKNREWPLSAWQDYLWDVEICLPTQEAWNKQPGKQNMLYRLVTILLKLASIILQNPAPFQMWSDSLAPGQLTRAGAPLASKLKPPTSNHMSLAPNKKNLHRRFVQWAAAL